MYRTTLGYKADTFSQRCPRVCFIIMLELQLKRVGKDESDTKTRKETDKFMARKSKMATQKEVLEFFTEVMRRESDDGSVKLSEAISAADKLYRYFRETEIADTDNKETGVVILPEINIEGSEK